MGSNKSETLMNTTYINTVSYEILEYEKSLELFTKYTGIKLNNISFITIFEWTIIQVKNMQITYRINV